MNPEKEFTEDNQLNEENSFNAMVQTEEMDRQRKANNTWIFEEKQGDAVKSKEYPLFIVNGEGNITIPITVNNRKLGYVSADFAWEDSEPFFDNMNIHQKEVSSVRDDVSTQKMDNITAKNVKLFKQIVTGGQEIELDEFNEPGETKEISREGMLELTPETKSSLISEYQNGFHIERFFPEGGVGLAALIRKQDKIFFKCSIGTYHNPAHVLIMEFDAPGDDARQSFDETFDMKKEQEGEVITRSIEVNYEARARYAKKHFVSVKGVSLGKEGQPFGGSYNLQIKGNPKDGKQYFRLMFNPKWWVDLGNALGRAFDHLGKSN